MEMCIWQPLAMTCRVWYAGAAVQRQDCTLAYIEQVLSTEGLPPNFELLPANLPPLDLPLPLNSLALQHISPLSYNQARLQTLAVDVAEQQQPAIVLADAISIHIRRCTVGRGEMMVLKDTLCLVMDPMSQVLDVLDIPIELGGDVADPSRATETLKRPDDLLFLRDVLMFKVCKNPPQPLVSMTLQLQEPPPPPSPRGRGGKARTRISFPIYSM